MGLCPTQDVDDDDGTPVAYKWNLRTRKKKAEDSIVSNLDNYEIGETPLAGVYSRIVSSQLSDEDGNDSDSPALLQCKQASLACLVCISESRFCKRDSYI